MIFLEIKSNKLAQEEEQVLRKEQILELLNQGLKEDEILARYKNEPKQHSQDHIVFADARSEYLRLAYQEKSRQIDLYSAMHKSSISLALRSQQSQAQVSIRDGLFNQTLHSRVFQEDLCEDIKLGARSSQNRNQQMQVDNFSNSSLENDFQEENLQFLEENFPSERLQHDLQGLQQRFCGEPLSKHFQVLGEFGKGRFGSVRLAVRKGVSTTSESGKKLIQILRLGESYQVNVDPTFKGKLFAIKSIHHQQILDKPGPLCIEIDALSRLDHQGIAKLHEAFYEENYFHLVSEFCQGGDLFDRLRIRDTFHEEEVAIVADQLLKAIKHSHICGVVHRDLKLENVVFKKKQTNINAQITIEKDCSIIKIVDYGLAQFVKKGTNLSSKVGTPFYVAPEVLLGSYDEKCDLWSIGIICYVLFCGYPPFYDDNHQKVFQMIVKNDLVFNKSDWERGSEEMKSFIKKLLIKSPLDRITVDQALNHPWLMRFKKDSKKEEKNPLDQQSYFQQGQIIQTNQDVQAEEERDFALALKQICLTFIDEGEFRELQQSFKSFDFWNKGYISKEQIYQFLLKNSSGRFQVQILSQKNYFTQSQFVALACQSSRLSQEAEIAFKSLSDSKKEITLADFERNNQRFPGVFKPSFANFLPLDYAKFCRLLKLQLLVITGNKD